MSDSDTTPAARFGTLRAALRVGEYALVLVGSACLIAYGGACARASLTQQREREAFDAAMRARMQQRIEQIHQESPNQREWSPARYSKYQAALDEPVQAIGRLEIPDANVSVMVLDGDDDHTLDRAVGRVPGTARPGERGNLGIAGHRDGYFRGLRHLEKGDAISLTTLDGIARYVVDKIEVVKPERTDVLAPSKEPSLTLITCYPFFHIGDAPSRYIVRARQVAYEPWASLDAVNDVASR